MLTRDIWLSFATQLIWNNAQQEDPQVSWGSNLREIASKLDYSSLVLIQSNLHNR